MYNIFTTEEFDKNYNKLDSELQRQVKKAIDQLESNPHAGKPLGYIFFREKKIMNYRIYYLIYDEKIVVFVITIGTKKDQQQSIDKIKRLIPYYHKEIESKINSSSKV